MRKIKLFPLKKRRPKLVQPRTSKAVAFRDLRHRITKAELKMRRFNTYLHYKINYVWGWKAKLRLSSLA